MPPDPPRPSATAAALPGRVVGRDLGWADVQQAMREGHPLSPLLPIGSDTAYLWIPKNGCSTLKRAWLLCHGPTEHEPIAAAADHDAIHAAALAHTHWLTPTELRQVARQRRIVAIGRDPIERFVSACRSHLRELTTPRFLACLIASAGDDRAAYEATLTFHHELLARHGVASYDENTDPVQMMNEVAVALPRWIPCHLNWSHHTLPQTSFLGTDPAPIASLLPMDAIDALVESWGRTSGRPVPPEPLHSSAPMAEADPLRRLAVGDLHAEALAALRFFYGGDRSFLRQWEEPRSSLR